MQQNDLELLSEYYQNELNFLRNYGKEFANKFPKIAKRLDLGDNESFDPHTERLIESFAFLCAKLQKQIDDQYSPIAYDLLNIICPSILKQIPSCAFAQLNINMNKVANSAGYTIARGSNIFASTEHTCTFTTTCDVQLFPLEIINAQIISKENFLKPEFLNFFHPSLQYIKLSIKHHGEKDTLRPKKIRIYLNGNFLTKTMLYSSMFIQNTETIIEKNQTFCLNHPIQPIGHTKNETMFTVDNTIHSEFNLLKEYFYFPDKFLGFDLEFSDQMSVIQSNSENQHDNFSKNEMIDDNFNVYIPITDYNFEIKKELFLLHAVPIVNIFSKTTDPINMDYKQLYYKLEPDVRNYDLYEIYSIDKLVYTDNHTKEYLIPPFLSNNHDIYINDYQMYWHHKKKLSINKDIPGDDFFISFTDLNKNLSTIENKTIYAYTRCTNRYNAEKIPAKTDMYFDSSLPIDSAYNIDRPTQQKPAIHTDTMWHLISILSLNNIAFDQAGIGKLKEILLTFANISNSHLKSEVYSMSDFEIQNTNMYIRDDWKTFIKGYNVSIKFDSDIKNDGIPLSFVLSKFLASYANINTFVELSVKNTSNECIKTWKAEIGKQHLF